MTKIGSVGKMKERDVASRTTAPRGHASDAFACEH